MGTVVKLILSTVAGMSVTYLCTSFVLASVDFTTWTEAYRIMTIMIGSFVSMIILGLSTIEQPKSRY